jgi:hypothetical protein
MGLDGLKCHPMVRYKYSYFPAFSMSKREQEVNTSPSQIQRDQQEAINRTFDQTRTNVRKTVNEAKKDISVYSEQFTNLQERAIDTARDITESYIESQRELFNSFIFFLLPSLADISPQHFSLFPASAVAISAK